ncbi:MAG TPA: winged helix-turn-helix domain-containing protein [Candidatus Thermoplasmatota archaeon]|nr:winged helix-turn-helix domain-containing protein [Candidatus Thermoplasmatota archaeon]
MPGDDLLQLLSNPTNRAILAHLAVEPLYTRRLAELVGLSEEETSRRLRSFERLGVLAAEWANVGRTVRLYRLVRKSLVVNLTGDGLSIEGIDGDPMPAFLSESPPAVASIVGREVELEALSGLAMDRRAVCLHGLGGIGKTTLLAAFAARWPGPVAWRTAAPGESAPLLLARLASALRRKAPVEGLDDEDDTTLVHAVAHAASAQGALLVLDRAEVATDGAVDAFADVARRLRGGAAIVAARAFPRALPRDFASFELGGLTREDARRLLGATGAEAERADRLHARSAGHPLSLLLSRDRLASDSDDPFFLGDDVRAFLTDDVLAALPATDRDAVLALAVLEVPFSEKEAEDVAEVARGHDLLLRLAARGLATRTPDGWMVHDLVRSVLSPLAPRSARSRAAKMLMDDRDPARGLEALRLALAGEDPKAAGAVVVREAVERTYRFVEHGFGDAYARLLLEASETVASKEIRAAALIERANLARRDGGDSAALLARAEPFAPSRGPLAARFLIESAEEARRAGDPPRALALYDRAAAESTSPNLTADALLARALLLEETDGGRAREAHERALEAAEQTDDPRLISFAYSGAARAETQRGGDGRAWAEEALRLARVARNLRGEVLARTALTERAVIRGGPGEAALGLLHARETLAVARRLGDTWLLACALCDVAILATRSGHHDEALAAGKEGIEAARLVASPYLELGAASGFADACVATGRAPEGRDAIAAATATFESAVVETPPYLAFAWTSLAAAEEACGHAGAAAAAKRRAREVAGARSG